MNGLTLPLRLTCAAHVTPGTLQISSFTVGPDE